MAVLVGRLSGACIKESMTLSESEQGLEICQALDTPLFQVHVLVYLSRKNMIFFLMRYNFFFVYEKVGLVDHNQSESSLFLEFHFLKECNSKTLDRFLQSLHRKIPGNPHLPKGMYVCMYVQPVI